MRMFLLAGLCFFSLSVGAEPSSRVAWTPATLEAVAKGDAQHGKDLAMTCAGCHNAESAFPNLDGQLATYLYRQLRDYRDGQRKDNVMSPMSESLSDQDIADIAAWFSRQKAFAGSGGGEDGTHIVAKGDGPRMEPPCKSCHGSHGEGQKADVPRLSGQKPDYLEKTLLAYKAGTRANDVYGRMRLIAEKLSEAEIRELARYYGTSK
jgi:cytochrome c553